jgi:hypothetical protein
MTMIESVKIRNFRCFSELAVDGLKPINIIVGENASGKTAFLESIFLSSGAAPQLALQLRAYRQLGTQVGLQLDASSYRGLWEDLFHQYDLSKIICVAIEGPKGATRKLWISNNRDANQTVDLGIQPIPLSPFPLIAFDWKREGAEPVKVTPLIQGNGLVFKGVSFDSFPTLLFGPHIPDPPQDDANRFSTLSKDGRIKPVIDALRDEFPFLNTLSLEINSGVPAVFADIQGGARKFPVGLISDGINKLLSLLLGIAMMPNGTVLIDQIEDGFYFKRIPTIWKIIHKFAKANGTQIFATTHSQECLNALLPVLEANEEDFALLRASRSDNSIRFSVSNGRRFASALSQEFELR